MIETNISTNENLVQDNSSIEYMESETNPINTTTHSEPLFDFNAVHNGEACIESLRPEDRGTERQFWFTRALLCTLLGVKSVNTIDNHVQSLINRGVIDNVKNLTLSQSPHGLPTTLYDLKVFNYLVMRLDTDKAWEMKAKFNDVLVERETGVTQAQTQFALPKTLPEALRLYAAEIEAKEKALKERDETRALLAEEREKVETLNDAVDNLTRTKAWINDKKVASALGTAGAKSKECERLREKLDKVESERDLQIYNVREAIRKEFEDVWMTARDWCYKHGLPVYVNEPKWVVSARLVEICAEYPDRDQWHTNASGVRLFPQWACDILDKMYDEDSTFLAEYRPE